MPNETRVLEMQFKNREFEKNIETSQRSLEKFKKDLNFDETSKGLKKFGESMEALNFTRMADNIQKLTDKFTGLGTVSEFVLSRVRRELEELADKAINFGKSLTFGQIDAGKEKFDSLNKSIQTIMASTGKSEAEVAIVMERLNEYTDMTSYNFADMASNIGKFTSVGIPLEQAEKQMEGIANWAARSGAGINEASRAMYNLSQAMGVGSLKLIDWKSIENAGMATKEFKEQMIEAGIAAGTLERTVTKGVGGTEKTVVKTAKSLGTQVEVDFQNLSQTLNKGWANTTVIGNTLMGYYYEDLQNKSSEGMIALTDQQKDLMNDLLKETGKIDKNAWDKIASNGLATDKVKEKLLEVAEAQGVLTAEIQEDGTKIYKTLDKTGKEVEFTFDTFEEGLKGTWLTKNVANATFAFDDLAHASYSAAQKCRSFSDVLGAWKDMISTGWMSVFQHIFGNLSESINLFSTICDKVSTNILSAFGKGGTIDQVFDYWDQAGGRESLWGIIIGETEGPDGEVLYEGAYGLIDILGDIKNMISDAFWDVLGSFAVDSGYTEEQMMGWMDDPELRMQYLAGRIKDMTEGIKNFILSVRAYFQEIPEGASKSRWEMIKDVVKAVFHVVSFAAQVVGGLFRFFGAIKEQLQPSIDAIVGLFNSLVSGVIDTETGLRKGEGITKFFTTLANVLKPITAVINKVVVGVTELIRAFVNWGKESGFFTNALQKIKMGLKTVWNSISGVATSIIGFIGDLFGAVKDLFANGFSAESLGVFKEKIKELFGGMWKGIKDALAPATDAINGFFSRIWNVISDAISGYFNNENTVGGKIIAWLKNAFVSLKTGLNKLIPDATGSIGGFFKKIGDAISGMFSGSTDILGSVKGTWSKLSNGLMSFFGDGVGGTVSSIWKTIKNAIGSLSGVGDGIKSVLSPIKNLFGSLKTVFSSVVAIFSNFGSMIKGVKIIAGKVLSSALTIIQVIFKPFSTFFSTLKDFAQKIWQFYNELTPDMKTIILLAIGAFAIITQVKKTVKKLITLTDSLTNLKKATTKKAQTALQSFAGKMLMIAGAIWLVGQSIQTLGSMSLGDLGKGVAAVAVILTVMGVFIKLMKDTFHGNKEKKIEALKTKDIFNMVLAIVGIAIAVKKMVKALEPLAGYSEQQLYKMGGGLIVICLAMAGVAKAVGKSKFDWKGGLGLVLFAASIGLLLKTLSGILKYRDETGKIDWQAILMMVGTLGVIVGAFSILAHEAKDNKGILYMAALAAAIGIMLKELMKVADISWEGLAKMGVMLGAIMLLMVGFVKIFPKEGSIKDSGLAQAIPLAVAIYLLIKALMPIANLKWEQIGKIGAVFGGVIIGIIAMIWAVNEFVSKGKNGGRGLKKSGLSSIIGLALGIGALILVLKQVADIGGDGNWEPIMKMLTVYAVIIGGLMALIYTVNKMTTKNGRGLKKSGLLGGLLSLVIGLALIIKVLEPMAGKDWEKDILPMLVVYGVIVAGIIVLMKSVSKFTKNNKQGKQAFLIMLGIVLMLQSIIYIMKKTQDMDSDKLLIVFGGLAAIFLAMAFMMKSISKFTKAKKNGTQAFVILMGMVLLIGAFAFALDKVKGIDSETMLAFSGSILILAVAMTKIMKVVGDMKAPGNGKAVAKKIALLAAALASIAALAGIVIWLAPKMDGVQWESMAKLFVGVLALTYILSLVIDELNDIQTVTKKGELKSKIAIMATAVLAMAGLMLAFALITPLANGIGWNTVGVMLAGTLGLSLILGIIVKELNAIKMTTKKAELKSKIEIMATAVVALAGLMLAFALITPMASNITWHAVEVILVGTLGLVAILGIVVAEINRIKMTSKKAELQSKLWLMGECIIAVAGLMAIYAAFVPTLEGVQWETVALFVGAVLALVGMVGLMVLFINKLDVSKKAGDLEKKITLIGLAIAAVAGIMLILSVTLGTGSLNNMNYGGFIAYVVGAMAVIAMAIWLINTINKLDVSKKAGDLNKKVTLVSLAIGAIAAVMLIFSLSLSQIQNTDPWAMVAYAGGVLIMMASIALLMLAFNKLEVPKNGKDYGKKLVIFILAIAAVVIASLVLSKCMKDIKGMSWEAIIAFAGGLGLLMVLMAAAILILSKINPEAGLKGIGLLSAALVALGGVIDLIGPLIGRGLSGMLQELGSGLYQFGTLIAPFADTMNNIDTGKLISQMEQILKVAEIAGQAGKYQNDIHLFGLAIESMSASFGVFADVSQRIGNPDQMGAFKLAEKLFSYGDSFKNFQSAGFGYKVDNIASGLSGFKSQTEGIPVDMSQFGGTVLLDKLLDYGTKLSEFKTGSFGYKLDNLGSGLSGFKTQTDSLPSDPMSLPGMKLLDALANQASNLQTLANLTALDSLGGRLSTLGGAFVLFAKGASSLNGVELTDDTMKSIQDPDRMIGILQSVISTFGSKLELPEMPSADSIDATFAPSLVALGGGLAEFVSACNGINGHTEDGLAAIGFLAEIHTNLVKTGTDGLKAIDGLHDFDSVGLFTIGKFGTDLKTLSGGLKNFITASNGINGKTEDGKAAIKFLAEIHEGLVKSGTDGLKAIDGLHDFDGMGLFGIGKFGTDLKTLSDGLKNFITASNGINAKTNAGLDAIDFLYNIHEKLIKNDLLKESMGMFDEFNEGDLAEGAEGKMVYSGLATFGNNISQLGNDLAYFADKVNFTEEGKARNFTRALKSLDFVKEMAIEVDMIRDPSVWQKLFGSGGPGKTLGELGSELETLGNSLGSFYDKVIGSVEKDGREFSADKLTAAFESIHALIKAAEAGMGFFYHWDETYGEYVITKVWDPSTINRYFANLSEFLLAITSTGADQWDSETNTLKYYTLAEFLASFITDFDAALGTLNYANSAEMMRDTAAGLVSFCEAAAKFADGKISGTISEGFIGIGASICTNITTGIIQGTQGVLDEIGNLVEQAYSAGFGGLEMTDTAKDLATFVKAFDDELFGGVDGLANENSAQVLRDTAEAVNFLVTAITKLSTIETPEIGPVIDLSKFEKQAALLQGGMNGLANIGANYTMTLKLDSGQFSTLAPKDYTNQFTEVSNKIGELKREINNLGNDIQRMKIVMDTGALVGAVAPGVDHYLGSNSFFESRLK